MHNLNTQMLTIDEKSFEVYVDQKVSLPIDVPRLLIVSYQPTIEASAIVETCICAIQRFTQTPYELWVIDNNSPRERIQWLSDIEGVNIVYNRTEPLPDDTRPMWKRLFSNRRQISAGSYANAIALEIGVRVIAPESQYIMPLHMDTMPCKDGWLAFLLSKMTHETRAVGVRRDTHRVKDGILHVLGFIVDFQIFRKFNLDFFPDLPQYDVGDLISVRLKTEGYRIFATHNTYNDPELIKNIPESSPFWNLHVDRSFDDDGNIIFLHLGRGIQKSSGNVAKGTTPADWIQFARDTFGYETRL